MIVRPAIARAIGALSRISGRGGGTTLPGRVLLRMAPGAIGDLGRRLDPVTVVSATNGKTTTAAMIASALRAAGREPAHNRAGSNMTWGIATALLGAGGADEGLFEVDEAWLPRVAGELDADVICLGNLFRDQLDRYGELERLADDWAHLLDSRAGRSRLVLNADDPLVADLGRDRAGEPRPGVTYFGIEDVSQARADIAHAHDAKHCRRCGAPYSYELSFMGHLGHYSCPNGDADRPRPRIAATRVDLHGLEGSSVQISTPDGEIAVELPLPGLYNVYNALAATATALELGVPATAVASSLEGAAAVFGRVETIDVAGTAVSILLIKNPVGASEVLRTLALDERGELHLWIALNDRIADGRDVSWVWDADFELLAGSVARVHCSGSRAPELANRLKYAGWDTAAITVDPDPARSFDAAVAEAPGRLFALPTYTALLELRTTLARRGLAEAYWR